MKPPTTNKAMTEAKTFSPLGTTGPAAPDLDEEPLEDDEEPALEDEPLEPFDPVAVDLLEPLTVAETVPKPDAPASAKAVEQAA